MKLLSLDIGLKRIGVAISQDEKIVTPLKAVIRKNRNQASQEIKAIIQEWQINKIIVGLPETSSRDEMFRRFSHFINLLNLEQNIEVIYYDEDYSSVEAMELMKGEIKFKKDGRLDSISAKIVLERYLESC
jgi:putative Holliday junction resolvase